MLIRSFFLIFICVIYGCTNIKSNESAQQEIETLFTIDFLTENTKYYSMANTESYILTVNQHCEISVSYSHSTPDSNEKGTYDIRRNGFCEISQKDFFSAVHALLYQFSQQALDADYLITNWYTPKALHSLVEDNCNEKHCFSGWNFNNATKTSERIVEYSINNDAFLNLSNLMKSHRYIIELERVNRFRLMTVDHCKQSLRMGYPIPELTAPSNTLVPCQVQSFFKITKP